MDEHTVYLPRVVGIQGDLTTEVKGIQTHQFTPDVMRLFGLLANPDFPGTSRFVAETAVTIAAGPEQAGADPHRVAARAIEIAQALEKRLSDV